MRPLLLASLALLLALPVRAQVCSGPITLRTQEDIDSFDCTVVESSLTIRQSFAFPITNLDGLSKLERVEGSLTIRDIDTVESLQALSSLQAVTDDITINDNDGLTSIGLPSSLTTLRNLWIQDNTSLVDLDGFEGLTSVSGNLGISDNPALERVSGFGALDEVVVELYLTENPSLVDISGLAALRLVGSRLQIDNSALEDIADLTALESLGDLYVNDNLYLSSFRGLERIGALSSLTVTDNPLLRDLRGLGMLDAVGRLVVHRNETMTSLGEEGALPNAHTIWLLDNPVLADIEAVRGVPTEVIDVHIADNPALVSLAPLAGVTRVSGNLRLVNNDALVGLGGLDALTSAGTFTVNGHASLEHVGSLERLEAVEGNLDIKDNPALTSLEGLGALTTVRNVSLVNNDALTDLGALSSLEDASLVTIQGNNLLASLDGLHNLANAFEVVIQSNAALPNLDGLRGLRSVTDDVLVLENPILESVDGLAGLEEVRGVVSIRDNPVLSNCDCGLYGLIEDGLFVSVRDNAPGCTSRDEITEPAPGQCSAAGVFFSEYAEGSSNNKAVEVYNATNATVDLAAFEVAIYFNGNTSPSAIPLEGLLAPQTTYVVANSSVDTSLLPEADLLSSSLQFNGDDAVVLLQNGIAVDAIGQVGFRPDPEWGSGDTSTQNNTLRRQESVCSGDTDPDDPFDPAVSWTGFPRNTFDGFGSHTAECGGTGNAPPFFTDVLEDQQVTAGETFSFDYDADDADGDALTFSLAKGPDGALLDPVSGILTWTPTEAQSGQAYTVTAEVTDDVATVQTTAELTVVLEGNAPPVFEDPPFATLLSEGVTFTVTFTAADPDGDQVTYALGSGPAGATVDADTGTLSWTISEPPDVYAFTITATDGEATAAHAYFVGVEGPLAPGLEFEALRGEIRETFAASTLGYDVARDTLYAEVEAYLDGSVRGIYTDFAVVLEEGEDPSSFLFERGINAEHTWPQSEGAGDEPQRSDMHILYPARANVNSARGNDPYAEIPDEQATAWYYLDQSRSSPPEMDRDLWTEATSGRFEPRESVKGDIARAMLYFHTLYESAADVAFFETQLPTLLGWHVEDPATVEEVLRSGLIARYQGNANPYVLDPDLPFRAYSVSPSTEPGLAGGYALSAAYPNPARGTARFTVEVAETQEVRVEVFDVLGRRVAVLHDGPLAAGEEHPFEIDGTRLPAGVYLYRALGEDFSATGRVIASE